MALESVCGLRDIRGPLPALCDGEAWPPSTLQRFAPPGCRMEPTHGTTTLAFIFQHGVIAAADTRASCGTLVSSPDAQKILPIHSSLLATTSGSSADCSMWARVLARECRLYEVRHGCQLTVAGAAKLLSTMLHRYRGLDLCVATILCGWDHRGPSLYYVYSDGTCLSGSVYSVGSGSPYAYSVLDIGYRYEMSTVEAYDLAQRAVYHATHRDAYSGGNVDLYHIQKGGWVKVERQDVLHFHNVLYRAEHGSNVCREEGDSLRSRGVEEKALCGGSEKKKGY